MAEQPHSAEQTQLSQQPSQTQPAQQPVAAPAPHLPNFNPFTLGNDVDLVERYSMWLQCPKPQAQQFLARITQFTNLPSLEAKLQAKVPQASEFIVQYLTQRDGRMNIIAAAAAARNAAAANATAASSDIPRRQDGNVDLQALSEARFQTFTLDQTVFNDPGPQLWPNAAGPRPTLTSGLPAGLIDGTPAQIQRPQEDPALFIQDVRHSSLRKTSGAENQLRKKMQDLVNTVDPNVKIDNEAENLLLEIADEFIDSVTNFACRLAKHRGSEALEIKDLQLHLDINHNIRIPGFSSDPPTQLQPNVMTSIPSQLSTNAGGSGGAKKSGGGAGPSGDRGGGSGPKRSARLAAVQQAKKDNRLL